MPDAFWNNLAVLSGWIIAIAGGLLVAFWVGLIVWTWKDIRSRSSDIFAALLAILLPALFNILGVLLYLLLRPKYTLAEQYDRALEEEALLREIEQAPACHKCGRPVQVEWRFCPYCETELRRPCPVCGQLLDSDWKRCPHCGAHPRQDEGQPTYAPPPPPAEQTPSPPPEAIPLPEEEVVAEIAPEVE